MTVSVILLRLGIQLDQGINAHDANAGLDGTLQLPDLAHTGFQHANLDYTVGALRRWLGTAEVHRFHHKRDYSEAEVNFGEVFMIWDRLFGTYRERPAPLTRLK